MQTILPNIQTELHEGVCIKNPESTDLGKRILAGSIDLIYANGFEAFTFRKVGRYIGSPEASIYRYFESKHKLLLYLTAWYWQWMENRLLFRLSNIASPLDRLERAIQLLTEEVVEDTHVMHINELKLHHIVISESSKAFLNKDVDIDNEAGVFSDYKKLVGIVAAIILEINPDYKYPRMLTSTVVEGAHMQRHFAAHLPRLTDSVQGEDSVRQFYCQLVLTAITA